MACRGGEEGTEGGAKPKGERKHRGPPRGPAALKQLIKFLVPLAGKRILVMLLLAVARTALSNRLARVQVSLPPPPPTPLHCRFLIGRPLWEHRASPAFQGERGWGVPES